MSDEYLDFFHNEFFKIYKPEKHLLEKATIAKNQNDYSKAIMYLNSILLINPENSQAKQKLLEIYPKAIQDVIDEGRYEDALFLIKKSIELDSTSKPLMWLKLKCYALRFISKYYPNEKSDFEFVWDTLKDLSEIQINHNMIANQGLAFAGNSDMEKSASLYIIVSIQEYGRELKETSDVPMLSEFGVVMIAKLKKHHAPKKIIKKYTEYLKANSS